MTKTRNMIWTKINLLYYSNFNIMVYGNVRPPAFISGEYLMEKLYTQNCGLTQVCGVEGDNQKLTL